MSDPVLITLNPGSSTIKLGLFALGGRAPQLIGKGIIDLDASPLTLRIAGGPNTEDVALKAVGMHDIIREASDCLMNCFSTGTLAAVGHRVVHGGDHFADAVRITDETLALIEALVPLAPLHQPKSVRSIKAIRELHPSLPQFASFDTAFHQTQSDVVRRFALPRALFDEGVKRYGFHGLSYKFIATHMHAHHPELVQGRIVVGHLGSGVSLCGLKAGVSRDTSMGFSTIDGVPMATRCGALDPGVLVHLMKERGWPVEKLEDVLYNRSGMLGISGISGDTRDLIGNMAREAREALDIFTFRVSREIVALANTLEGLDGIVFTAGIGEHQPEIREAVCQHLAWLGVRVDSAANSSNAPRIEAKDSKVAVLVVPTDEEQVIAEEAYAILSGR
jgi:acetate kinase